LVPSPQNGRSVELFAIVAGLLVELFPVRHYFTLFSQHIIPDMSSMTSNQPTSPGIIVICITIAIVLSLWRLLQKCFPRQSHVCLIVAIPLCYINTVL